MNDGEYEEILEDMKEEGQKFGMYIQHFFFPPVILLCTFDFASYSDDINV